MKKTLIPIAILLAAATPRLAAFPDQFVHRGGDEKGEEFEPNCLAESQRAYDPPIIDGVLNEGMWKDLSEEGRSDTTYVSGFPHLTWDGTDLPWGDNLEDDYDPQDISGTWMAAWDEDYLYIAGRVVDEAYLPGIRLDAVELFLDGDASLMEGIAWNVSGYNVVELNDWHVVISEDEESYGLHSLNGENDLVHQQPLDIEQAFVSTESGWDFEIRIGWASIYGDDLYVLDPKIDEYIGFDIKIRDADEESDPDHVISWCSETNDTYSDVSQLGVLVLGIRVVECDRYSWWETDKDGYVETGLSWLYTDFWPMVYTFGLNHPQNRNWIWVLWYAMPYATSEEECPSPDSFWAFHYGLDSWVWGRESWGYFYVLDWDMWVKASTDCSPLPWWRPTEGFCSTNLGWLYVQHWPYVYSYASNEDQSSDGGDWMWFMGDDPERKYQCAGPEEFYGYNLDSQKWFKANEVAGGLEYLEL